MLVDVVAPQFVGRSLEEQRAALDAMGSQAEMPAGMMVARSSLAGVPLEQLTPANRERRVVLYVHGGGFTMGSCESHRALAGRIGAACRARVVLPEYRLAPEHPFPAGLEDLVAVYRALLASGTPAEQIIVVGDSAGGGLAVSMLLRAREAGLPSPRAMVLLSPWLDLTCSGESMQTRADVDPWLRPDMCLAIRDFYLADADPSQTLASPLMAELAGLPPMLIQVGDHEILLSDAKRMAVRAWAAGIDAELQVSPDLWHVFQLFAPMLPDAVEAIERIGTFVDQRFEQPAVERFAARPLRRVG
ncbi:alpha/beta hydrolase [Nannocystaceae bacterium ST9]